jgi:hypothetical protein
MRPSLDLGGEGQGRGRIDGTAAAGQKLSIGWNQWLQYLWCLPAADRSACSRGRVDDKQVTRRSGLRHRLSFHELLSASSGHQCRPSCAHLGRPVYSVALPRVTRL